jgi:sec-independent protein translocase protein TatC
LAQHWQRYGLPHLAELQVRLWVAIALTAVACGLATLWASPFIGWAKGLAPPQTLFVQLVPGEAMWVWLKAVLVVGLGLSLPVWVGQGAAFLAPALTPTEAKWLGLGMALLTGCALAGAGFALWLLLPATLSFLLSFGEGLAVPQLSLASYMATVWSLVGLTALVFELPVLMLVLSMCRIVPAQRWLHLWREATVASLLIAAIVTPTQDPVTLLILAVPLLVLYGGMGWLCRVLVR